MVGSGAGDVVVSGVGDTGVVVGAHAPNAIASPEIVIKLTNERVIINPPKIPKVDCITLLLENGECFDARIAIGVTTKQ